MLPSAFNRVVKGFQLLTIFCKMLLLRFLVWFWIQLWIQRALSRITLVLCLTWTAHRHIDGVIIFVFWCYLFHMPLLIYTTQSGANKLDQRSRLNCRPVFHFSVSWYNTSSLWPQHFLRRRPLQTDQ